MEKKCMEKTEVYSRVVGYFRPVQQWNKGKQEEFKERREFEIKTEEAPRGHANYSRN
jgi:ribonucleoside-triphosphate reductase